MVTSWKGPSSRHCTSGQHQRWSRGHKARGQEHKKKLGGQGQECSRPRTQAQVFSKKFFLGDFQLRDTKKVFANFPRDFWRFPRKFQRFKKKCCPRTKDRAIFEEFRLQGQGLQNVSSRPRTTPHGNTWKAVESTAFHSTCPGFEPGTSTIFKPASLNQLSA